MDWHLNLFYSYNQDNELIENNLTRAFIVTLRLLSPITKHRLLHTLLKKSLCRFGEAELSFHSAKLALQSHIDLHRILRMPKRYLLTLTSDRIVLAEEEGQQDWSTKIYSSIPDGWIYDYQAGWCILIEAKVGANPLNEQQLISHAVKWLSINSSMLSSHLISLNWRDVISAIQQIESVIEINEINQQERMLLSEFMEFLGYYGYRKFEGLIWKGLQLPPEFMLRKHRIGRFKRNGFLQFSNLVLTPSFGIKD